MKQDRYNFTRLGKFDREEGAFRDRFKKKFNQVMENFSRNDFDSLKEVIAENDKLFSKTAVLSFQSRGENLEKQRV